MLQHFKVWVACPIFSDLIEMTFASGIYFILGKKSIQIEKLIVN